MTQEEKDLLLRDLCARLPYGVKVPIEEWDGKMTAYPIYSINADGYAQILTEEDLIEVNIADLRPYLRPMSSMTDDEVTEIDRLNKPAGGCWVVQLSRDKTGLFNNFSRVVEFRHINKVYDWLNAHHFDFRGLIEKGLAIEAPDSMY